MTRFACESAPIVLIFLQKHLCLLLHRKWVIYGGAGLWNCQISRHKFLKLHGHSLKKKLISRSLSRDIRPISRKISRPCDHELHRSLVVLPSMQSVYETVKRPSVCLSRRSTAATACGGFAAERPAGRRYRQIAGDGAQQLQMRVASRWEPTEEAEQRLDFLTVGLLPDPTLAGGSVAEWLACWTQTQKGPASNRSLSGNSLRQTVHTHCASVHQAAKLVAAVLFCDGTSRYGVPENLTTG